MQFACHCCGYLTMDEEPTDTFDICPVCFWEHEYMDGVPELGLCHGMANGVTLEQGRENFKRIGAVTERDLPHVRKPLPEEYPPGGTA